MIIGLLGAIRQNWLLTGGKEYLLTDDTTNVDVTDCDTLLKENTI